MPHAYSLDLRKRVLKDCDQGMSSENAARKYSVSISWVYDLRKRRRDTGSIEPKQYKRGPKRKLEGDIVMMDNLSSHKVAGVAEAIQSVGAKVLYLPPYSPDFNPIEMVFSKLKTLVRSNSQDAKKRTISTRQSITRRIHCPL